MATKVLLMTAILSQWSFFKDTKAELSLEVCRGGYMPLQETLTNITCDEITGVETLYWDVTFSDHAKCTHTYVYVSFSHFNATYQKCSESAMFNTSLNQQGNVSVLTLDLTNSSDSLNIFVACYWKTGQTNCTIQYSPGMNTTENTTQLPNTTTQRASSLTTTAAETATTTAAAATTTTTTVIEITTTATAGAETTTTTTTTAATTTTTTTEIANTTTTATAPTTALTTPQTTTVTVPTTGQAMGNDSSTKETTHVTSPASTAEVENTSTRTTDTTVETRILDKAEVAAIAGGAAAFVALLVVLVVIVLVCRRRGKQRKYTATHRNRGTRASTTARRTASKERSMDHPHFKTTNSETPDTLEMTSHQADSHHRKLEDASPASDVYPYAVVEKRKQPMGTSTVADDVIIYDVGSCDTADPDPENLTMNKQHPLNHEGPLLLTKEWSPVIPRINSSQLESKKPPDQGHKNEGHLYADIDIGNHAAELAIERDGTLAPETEMYATPQPDKGARKNAAKSETALADHTTDHVGEEKYNTLSFTPRRPSLEAVEENYSHVTSHVTDDLEYNTLRYDASRENPWHAVEDDYNHIT